MHNASFIIKCLPSGELWRPEGARAGGRRLYRRLRAATPVFAVGSAVVFEALAGGYARSRAPRDVALRRWNGLAASMFCIGQNYRYA